MSLRAVVVGVGEPAAGDDGVGRVVLGHLRAAGVAADVELRALRDPTELVDLLGGDAPVIVVDAVAGAPAGEVLELSSDELAARGAANVSTHGVGVVQAIELARALHGGAVPAIRIVGVGIERPGRLHAGLSPAVAAAVAGAAGRVRALLGS